MCALHAVNLATFDYKVDEAKQAGGGESKFNKAVLLFYYVAAEADKQIFVDKILEQMQRSKMAW